MQLETLLLKIPGELIRDTSSTNSPEIVSIEYDSRRVSKQTLFVAIKGLTTDGNRYIDQAIQKGASVIVSENPAPSKNRICWIRVQDARSFLSFASSAFFGFPSEKLDLAGITGTNGKTTTAFLTHSILSQDKPAVMIGTLGSVIGEKTDQLQLTTPESVEIQRTLAEGISEGCETGVLEVSSHSLFFKRVLACHFKIGVFTNLSQDHLDFHSNFDSYFATKSLLFQRNFNPGIRWSLLNIDDPWGRKLVDQTDGEVITYGFSESAHIHPLSFQNSTQGIRMELSFFDRKLTLNSFLVGRHNGYNIMAAAAAGSLLGIEDSRINQGISSLQSIPGRFEVIPLDQPFTVVNDFAHTPDALSNVLDLARQLTSKRVLCVFGCGGDRDKEKRPQMGKISVEKADYSILTSDNPRSEDPEAIIKDILAGISDGFSNYETVTDRREAIRRALRLAQPGDLILLAGKGHENYQEIEGQKHVFDERVIVKEEACCLLE